MRYETGSPMPEVVKTDPHVAFEVEDLDLALQGKDVIIEPNSPSDGVKVAFILEDGAPIEFIEYQDKWKDTARPGPISWEIKYILK